MKIHSSTSGLKPCACGSESLTLHHKEGGWKFGFVLICDACGAMTPWARLSSVARALWNRGDRQPTVKEANETRICI